MKYILRDVFHIQSNHTNYIILLISTSELPALYTLANSGIKAEKQNKTKKKKKKKRTKH